jgi:starvation-inducible DNA-binding protein
MYRSPNSLPEASRGRIAAALDATLADGIDLHGALKSAHWNLKGPLFATLHPLFETIAVDLEGHNDDVAERAVTLGGRVHGTARHVASASRLAPYPEETTRDLDHVRLLADRIDGYLAGVRSARATADEEKDQDTVDLLTGVVEALEKHGWFLRATLAE